MEIFDMARMLGLALKESDEGKRLAAARKAYEEDERIVALTTEFDVQQKALASMVGNKDADEKLTGLIQARLSEIYDEVLKTEAYKLYESAQKDFDALAAKVQSIMMGQISGVPEGCTHDCSTCGGCR